MINKKQNTKFLIAKTNSNDYLIPLKNILFIEKLELDNESADARIDIIKGMPDFVLGVMNYKSKPYPILDMEMILHNEKTISHNENKIVFMKINDIKIGMLFNDVFEIKSFELSEERIKPSDDKPLTIATANNKNYFIIDIDRIFNLSSKFNYFVPAE